MIQASIHLHQPPAQPNRSLADGMAVLLQLVSAGRPVGSRELARELGFEATRVNRLLGTLAGLGMAERTAQRKYLPGPGVHVMAALSLGGSRLLPAALPVLTDLQNTTGLGVALGVLWRRHACYLFHGGADRPLAEGIAGHHLYAAEQSSIGLALLAAMPAAEVDLIFSSPNSGGLDRETLARRLALARQHGFADNEDRSIAVVIAAAGRSAQQPVAAVALIGVPSPPPETAIQALKAAAQAIAVRLAE